jgi:molybdenum cofactor cytidylyltransferase
MISAIILAAGRSERMSRLKQLMPWQQSTVLEQTVDNFLGSKANEVIVVVGYRAEEVRRVLAGKPVRWVINPDYEQGMSASIIAGLSLVDDQTQAVMLALGDQPLINSQTISRLIDEFSGCDKGIVIPTYRGRRGHPVIFALTYKEQLLQLKGDVGGRQIIARHPEDVLEVAVDCEGVCIDIDTVENYCSIKSDNEYMGGKLRERRH